MTQCECIVFGVSPETYFFDGHHERCKQALVAKQRLDELYQDKSAVLDLKKRHYTAAEICAIQASKEANNGHVVSVDGSASFRA